MPDSRYICVIRSDIPRGYLQVLDLKPNESQRNLVYDPPGQTRYLNYVENETVATVVIAGGHIALRDETSGLAAYLLDNVEAGGLGGGPPYPGFTAVQAIAAATAIIARMVAGNTMAIGDVNTLLSVVVANTELTNAGGSTSTGILEELLSLLAGSKYTVPALSIITTSGTTFNTARSGSFPTGTYRDCYITGMFTLSYHDGELAGLLDATFEYQDTAGAAITIYDNVGALV